MAATPLTVPLPASPVTMAGKFYRFRHPYNLPASTLNAVPNPLYASHPVIALNSIGPTAKSTSKQTDHGKAGASPADPRRSHNWRSGEERPTMKREEDKIQIVNATSHPRLKAQPAHHNKDLFVPVGWDPGDHHKTESFLHLKPSEYGYRETRPGEEEGKQKMPVDCWVALDSRVEVPRGDLVEYRFESLGTDGDISSSQQYELEGEDTDRLRRLVSRAMEKRQERQRTQAEVDAGLEEKREAKQKRKEETEGETERARPRKEAAHERKENKGKQREDAEEMREWRRLAYQGTHGECPLPKTNLRDSGVDRELSRAQQKLEDTKWQNERVQRARDLKNWRTGTMGARDMKNWRTGAMGAKDLKNWQTDPMGARAVFQHSTDPRQQSQHIHQHRARELTPTTQMSEEERTKAKKAQSRAVLAAGSQRMAHLNFTSKNLQDVQNEARLEEKDAKDLRDIHRCIDDLEPAIATLNELCEQLTINTTYQPSQPPANPFDYHAESEVMQRQQSMGTGTLNAAAGVEEERQIEVNPVDEIMFTPTGKKRGFSGFCRKVWDKRPGKTVESQAM